MTRQTTRMFTAALVFAATALVGVTGQTSAEGLSNNDASRATVEAPPKQKRTVTSRDSA